MSALHHRAFGRRVQTSAGVRTGAAADATPITEAQREVLEEAAAQLDALIRALAARTVSANFRATVTGLVLPPLGILRDTIIPVSTVARLLDDGLYQWRQTLPVVLQAARAGSITNPSTQEKRQATRDDFEKLMTVMGRTTEYFEAVAELSEAFAVDAVVRDLFAKTMLSLAELASWIYEAMKALLKGVKNTASTAGFLLPVAALAAGGLLLWRRAR